MKERCWDINEKHPIDVKVIKTNNEITLLFEPMTITYDTFDKICSNVDLSCASYDYEDGRADLTFKVENKFGWDSENEFIKKFHNLINI